MQNVVELFPNVERPASQVEVARASLLYAAVDLVKFAIEAGDKQSCEAGQNICLLVRELGE